MERRIDRFFVALLLVWLGCFPQAIRAQQVTGNIVGNVQDAQGAVVVGAQVTARNQETGFTRTVETSSQGEYRLDFVPPGSYEVEVTSSGFRSFRQTGVVLQVGQSARVDAHLQLGEASSTITVEGGVPAINTSDATVGQTVTTEQITTLPLVGRNAYSLLTLTPGVQNTQNAIALGFPAQRTFINGGADATMGSVNYYLDGGPNISSLRNTGNIVPNPDALKSSAWTPTTTAPNLAVSGTV